MKKSILIVLVSFSLFGCVSTPDFFDLNKPYSKDNDYALVILETRGGLTNRSITFKSVEETQDPLKKSFVLAGSNSYLPLVSRAFRVKPGKYGLFSFSSSEFIFRPTDGIGLAFSANAGDVLYIGTLLFCGMDTHGLDYGTPGLRKNHFSAYSIYSVCVYDNEEQALDVFSKKHPAYADMQVTKRLLKIEDPDFLRPIYN